MSFEFADIIGYLVALCPKKRIFNLLEIYIYKNEDKTKTRLTGFEEENGKYFLTFIPAGKETYNSDGYLIQQKGKIGKILKTIISEWFPAERFTDSEYEEIVNILKSYFSKDSYKFELVKGEDIRKYYLEDNYIITKSSTLTKSCMRYRDCQKYFDLYCDNPFCEMLIMFDTSLSSEEIIGRAIVWTINGEKYVDRRYYILDSHHEAMLNYIMSQKWNYKTYNTYDDDYNEDFSVYRDGDYVENSVTLEIDWYSKNNITKYEYYPYCDTLKYFNNGVLTNYEPDKGIKLSDTSGHYENINFECAYCGRNISLDDYYYSALFDRYYCCDCSVYSNYYDDYIPNNQAEEVQCEFDVDFLLTEDVCIKTILIDGVYYLVNDCSAAAYEVDRLDKEEQENLLTRGFELTEDLKYLIKK